MTPTQLKGVSMNLRESLDHPVFFVIVITVAVVCMSAIFSWGFKAAGLPGPAGLFQHP